jgi:hypothetical protein
MPTLKEKLAEFERIPEVSGWLDGIAVKPSTRSYYNLRLYEFLAGEEPKAFIERALKNQREVTIEIKGRIGQRARRSPSEAVHMQAALKSFLQYYETGVHVNGKIRVRRAWQKRYLSWEDGERIISKCKEPYESIFRFMLWSGLGQDEIVEINESPAIQKKIADQMSNSKDYVIIDLEPRKTTLSRYFSIVPKQYLPKFPLKTGDYKIRGNKPMHRKALEDNFRSAAQQTGLYEKGTGPHTFRSIFTSACAMAGVAQAVAEFAKGHGGGDKYGYSREVLNEEYVVKELRKLWEHTKPATESDLKQLNDKYETLRQYVANSLIKELPPEKQALARARLTEMSTVEEIEKVVRELSKGKAAARRR